MLGTNNHRVAWHAIETACHQTGNTFGNDERHVGKIGRYIPEPIVVIVEANNVQRTGTEQVIARAWFVASGGNRTRSIKGACHFGQFARKQRIDG